MSSSYSDYVSDDAFQARYATYQQRYADSIRESDKVLLRLVAEAAGRPDPRVLDIGCSTGNFLRHLRGAMPEAQLTGGDMAAGVLEGCRSDPALSGIDFRVMDMTAVEGRYDVVVANAVGFFLTAEEYERALAGIARALEPGGAYIAFEWLHPFVQELAIREVSKWRPDGLTIHARSFDAVDGMLRRAGFREVEFKPFEIPFDLQPGATVSDNADVVENLVSYTVRTEDAARLTFRGALYQPWCHFVART
jgi:SAM-dependent methyltransferase